MPRKAEARRETAHYEHVLRPINDLIGYARNARLHSTSQVDMIASSIREFGFTNPCLIDESDNLIAGHGRVLAAKKLKMSDVPCIVVAGLSETQRKALVLADNQLALKASWDVDMLVMELGDLQDSGFDLKIAGFTEDDLASLLSGVSPGGGLTDPDDAPEAPLTPVSVLGDVWVLDGRHRIACGDSTTVEAVDLVLAGVKPHLMVTDPPYGVEFDPDKRNRFLKDSSKRATGRVMNDDRVDWREAWALFPGDVAYVWHAPTATSEVQDSLKAHKFEMRSQIVWSKTHFSISRGHYHWQHELCWYAVRGSTHWTGNGAQSTIWPIDHRKSETGHSTQKPIDCMQRPMENNSSAGQAVYDPFVGSGTSIIAAERTGRVCHAIEINPAFVDVAVKRWMQFTGKAAIHEATGQTFDQLSADRGVP